MFIAAMFAIIVVMAMTLLRAILGPTEYDRILAVNKFGTTTTLFICVIGFLTGRPDFVDIALVYALVNFISTVAVLRYYEYSVPVQETTASQEPFVGKQPSTNNQSKDIK